MQDSYSLTRESDGDLHPTVAVVIPAWNEEANLLACLNAVAGQEYPSGAIHIVLVDNGSTDATRELAASNGATVLLDGKATIARLRNLGAEHTDTEVLAFLDGDMIPVSSWLARAVPVLREERVGAVGGLLDIPADAGWVARAWSAGRRIRPYRAEFGFLPSGNLLVNRAAFRAVGGFDERLTTCEDVDICARLRAAGYRLVFVRDATVVHTGEPRAITAMFRKELWRGRDSIGRLPRLCGNPREIPSVLLPVIQLIFLFLPLALLLIGRSRLAVGSLALPLFLPVLRAGIVSFRLRHAKSYMHLFVVWYIYYLARALAVLPRRSNK